MLMNLAKSGSMNRAVYCLSSPSRLRGVWGWLRVLRGDDHSEEELPVLSATGWPVQGGTGPSKNRVLIPSAVDSANISVLGAEATAGCWLLAPGPCESCVWEAAGTLLLGFWISHRLAENVESSAGGLLAAQGRTFPSHTAGGTQRYFQGSCHLSGDEIQISR